MSFLSSATKSDLNHRKQRIEETSTDVLEEFKSFLDDVEDLFHTTASSTGDDLTKARAQLKDRIKTAKKTVGSSSGTILKQARKTADITNNYVHKQPWTVLGTGVALSFLVGFLLSRRD